MEKRSLSYIVTAARSGSYEELLGVIFREAYIIPDFSGASISFGVDNEEEESEDKIIFERQIAYLKDLLPLQKREGLDTGFVIPSGCMGDWKPVLIELFHRNNGEFLNPIDEWEIKEVIPNRGYPGNVWEWVIPGGYQISYPNFLTLHARDLSQLKEEVGKWK